VRGDARRFEHRIVDVSKGFEPLQVAVALRTSEAIVRRVRLAGARDAERGRATELDSPEIRSRRVGETPCRPPREQQVCLRCEGQFPRASPIVTM